MSENEGTLHDAICELGEEYREGRIPREQYRDEVAAALALTESRGGLSVGAQELHALICDLTDAAGVSNVRVFTVTCGEARVEKGGKIEATGDGCVVVTNPVEGRNRDRVVHYAIEHVVGVSFDRINRNRE